MMATDRYDPPMLAGQPMMKPQPPTVAQAKRIVRDESNLAARRAIANVELVFEQRPMIEGEVNCARCHYLGGFNSEHQKGYCLFIRRVVSTWHAVKCEAFEQK